MPPAGEVSAPKVVVVALAASSSPEHPDNPVTSSKVTASVPTNLMATLYRGSPLCAPVLSQPLRIARAVEPHVAVDQTKPRTSTQFWIGGRLESRHRDVERRAPGAGAECDVDPRLPLVAPEGAEGSDQKLRSFSAARSTWRSALRSRFPIGSDTASADQSTNACSFHAPGLFTTASYRRSMDAGACSDPMLNHPSPPPPTMQIPRPGAG